MAYCRVFQVKTEEDKRKAFDCLGVETPDKYDLEAIKIGCYVVDFDLDDYNIVDINVNTLVPAGTGTVIQLVVSTMGNRYFDDEMPLFTLKNDGILYGLLYVDENLLG